MEVMRIRCGFIISFINNMTSTVDMNIVHPMWFSRVQIPSKGCIKNAVKLP